jgi:hypothetical protein
MLKVMRAKRPLRSAFVVTLSAASALLGACGGSTETGAGTTDGGNAEGGNCPISRNPPAPICPSTMPAGGTSCECYPSGFSCPYGNSMCNGQPNPTESVCSGGQWTLAVSTCNPPGMLQDSGADSGHDGGGDADGGSNDAQRTD